MLTPLLKKRLKQFLEDDAASDDVTAAITPKRECIATIKAEDDCVLAGLEEAIWLFKTQGVHAKALKKDGEKVAKESAVLSLKGSNRKILSTERVALNVMARMTSVATACNEAVGKAGKHGVSVAVTRKTTPGFQELDKKAACTGGALPHRADLSKMILLKDNHLKFFHSVSDAIAAIPRPEKAEVEVETYAQAREAAKTRVGAIMLDNFPATKAKKVMEEIRKRAPQAIIELSGGITPDNLERFARLKPDVISMGWLTKNPRHKEFSLEIFKIKPRLKPNPAKRLKKRFPARLRLSGAFTAVPDVFKHSGTRRQRLLNT